ncbi:unnamed protein product [Sphagnum troendelagicum]|uniref:Uncharacterized protein n=1 Tax=Sphagnum troendelagicum TaxID=128251 RepID=A0ABP0UQD7_9BRYO
MESRRITRKQAQQQSAGSAAGSPVVHSARESKKAGSARRTTSRKPLADRTNDSPIFGLTPCGNKIGGGRKSSPIYERTPISKLRSFKSCTPGTPGEEILRSQVNLDVLKAVEKVSISLGSLRPVCSLYSQFLILQSPSPELLNLDGLLQPVLSAESLALHFDVQQVITRMEDEKPEAKGEDEEGCDGEADTDGVSDQTELPNLWKQRGGRSVKITEGSMKMVNAASQETTTNDEYQEYEGNYEADEEEEEGGEYEELCRGISHISMRDSRDGFGPPPFAGRHTRFHYNSEGEIDSVQVDEEEDMEKSPEATPTTVMRLRGLPSPKGKHLRFTEDI